MMNSLSKNFIKACGAFALLGTTLSGVAQTFNWSPAGPIYTAGRVRNMVVDKNATNNLYVGSTSSGVFKSSNGGANWGPIDDQGTIRNISYMAQDKNGDIFVGTGEGFLRASQKLKALPGTGLYKLTGNNLTSVASATVTGAVISKIACSPVNAGQMAIATENGVLISTNGGSSFSPANGINTSGAGLDLKFDANGILYCSIGGEATTGVGGTTPSRVWKANGSDLSSALFADITPTTIAVTNTVYGRIELAISPSNPQVVYASCAAKLVPSANHTSTLSGLFVSYNGGSTWGTVLIGSAQLDYLFNGSTRASGDFAHCITVDPSNPNSIIAGGYYLYTWTRTGGTDASPIGTWLKRGNPSFFNTQLYLHENIHDVKIIGSAIYIVTDAGIYRTIDNYLSFQPFYSGLVTGQFNSVSIERYPLSSTQSGSIIPYNGYIGGTGGNGMVYFRGNYPNVTEEIPSVGGDIFSTEYSKILPNAAFFTNSGTSIFRNSDVRNSEPAALEYVKDTKNQGISPLTNATYTSAGTPFKLWEYYGQLYKGQTLKSPDSLVFYNDSSFALSTINSLTATTNFTFSIGRPQKTAVIDHVSIKVMTVTLPSSPSTITISNYTSSVNNKTMEIQCSPSFTLPAPGTATAQGTATVPLISVEGFTNASPLTSNKITVNSFTKFDQVVVSMAAPIFSAMPVSNPPVTSIENYVRVKATVYYRYKAGDSLYIVDNSISTLGTEYGVKAKYNMQWTFPVTSTLNASSNPVQRFPLKRSARLAVAMQGSGLLSGVLVSKAPLDMNSPLNFVKISGNLAFTDDANGNPLSGPTNTVVIAGEPILLEWSKSGTELYYATSQNYLYRVSHIYDILDSSNNSYGGKLFTGILTNTATQNPRSPYRTTFLGNFPKPITSINVASNDSILTLTFDDPTGTSVMVNQSDIRKCNNTNVNFVNKSGNLSNRKVYCALMEKSNYKKVIIGTDNGVWSTSDITAGTPSWQNVNNALLPNVQVFDIKQQTMNHWECYNSGQIYVATNGRGVWTNSDFYSPSIVSVEEIVKSGSENNLKLFPNPTSGEVFVSFRGFEGEKISIQVMDINGRLVKTENLGTISAGDVNYSFDTADLTTGVYIVNVNSDSGMRRVSKIIVTK